MEQLRGWSTKKAELLLMAANCALAAAQPQAAQDWAQAAYHMFRSQRRAWWQAHAARVLVQARYRVGPASPALLRQANRAAARRTPWVPATRRRRICWPGELRWNSAAATTPNVIWEPWPGPDGAVRPCHGSAAGSARRCEPRPQTVRAGCWPPAVGVLTSWTSTGSPSAPPNSGRKPPCMAPSWPRSLERHAARAGRPRLLLTWSERWRAAALAVPAVRPLADAELNAWPRCAP